TVGVNKAANAGLYAMKILANEFTDLQKKLRRHKEKQHNSVIKESDEMKKLGLAKFAKKKYKT
ncbi:MAG: 5-(carboxyamino)imidazole ribonucleotide mutase, partial [Nitrosopumilaceae archaeon]